MRDDTAFVQAWVDSGKPLSDLPPGTYYLSEPIRMPRSKTS